MNKIEHSIIWKAVGKIESILLFIAMISVAGIMLAAAFCRYTSVRFIAYEELVLIAAFWLYMIGAARGTREKTMITADLVGQFCGEGLRKDVMRLLEKGVTAGLNIVFLLWSVQYLLWAMEKNGVTAILKVPLAVIYSSIVCGLGLMLFYNLLYFFETIAKIQDRCGSRRAEKTESGVRS